MTMNRVISHDSEPTPEFNARGVTILQQWQAGQLPFQSAIATLTALAQEAAASGHLANQGRAEHFLGYMQHYRGNLNTSIIHYDRSRSLFQRLGNRDRVAMIDMNQGENYRNKGEFARARRLYRSAYEAATSLKNLRVQTISIVNEGLTLISMKDYPAARAALDEGYRLSEQWTPELPGIGGLRCEIYHGLATLELLADNAAAAWTHARQALVEAQQAQQVVSVGYAYRILGEVMTELGDSPEPDMPANPDEYYRSALDAFREVNAEGEIGRTIYCQAKSQARRGKRRAAAQMFREAMVIFTRLGMTDDAAKAAEAQLRVI